MVHLSMRQAVFSSPTKIASTFSFLLKHTCRALLDSSIRDSVDHVNLKKKSKPSPRERRMHGVILNDYVANLFETVDPVQDFLSNISQHDFLPSKFDPPELSFFLV